MHNGADTTERGRYAEPRCCAAARRQNLNEPTFSQLLHHVQRRSPPAEAHQRFPGAGQPGAAKRVPPTQLVVWGPEINRLRKK